jgi:tetratricopeptide (TPR) repeat protein
MSVALALVVAVACSGERLDEARALLRQGLLTEAERILDPIAAQVGDSQRAPAQLLLGNVEYERGRYEGALARYFEAEQAGAGDDSLVEAARSNRALAQARLDRAREVSALVSRLRAGVISALVLGAAAVSGLAWRARRPPVKSDGR